MVTRKGTSSTTQQKHRRIVKEIENKFGKVIDLERSPMVLVEIIRQFGPQFDEKMAAFVKEEFHPAVLPVAGPPDPPKTTDPPDPRASETGRSGHETASHHAEGHQIAEPETG